MSELSMLLLKMTSNSAPDGAATAAGILAVWTAMFGFFWIFYCFAILIGLVFFVIWLWALVDCLSRKDYDSENEKLLWALVILFAGIIGAAIYYFLVKRKKDMEKKTAEK